LMIKHICLQLIQILVNSVLLQMSENKSREEQLKQQMTEKEEKTKKIMVAAKAKITQVNSKFARTFRRADMLQS